MSQRERYEPPGELVTHVTEICGDEGRAWLADLSRTVPKLETKWGVTTEPAFEKGEYNFVAPARSDTVDAVLKVSPPYPTIEIYAEAAFLRHLAGDGAVRLLEVDREDRAILVERVRPGLSLDEYFADDPFACVGPAIKALKKILGPPPPHAEVQRLDDWVDKFSRFGETDFPGEYGERAHAIFQRLREDADRIYYLHGDYHPGNVVSFGNDEFVAIDPKGLIGHVAYEISVFLNNLHWWQKGNPHVKRRLHAAARTFADAFDLDEGLVRDAAYAGMVIGAWWNFVDMPAQYKDEVVLADVWDLSDHRRI